MEVRLKTRRQVEKRIKEWTAWGAAALLGTGVALSLTIIFIGPGLLVLGLGVVVAVVGWMATLAAPLLFDYHRLRCPHCGRVTQVVHGVLEFECDYCARHLVANQNLVEEVKPMRIAGPVRERRILILLSALFFLALFAEVYLGHYAHIATWPWYLTPTGHQNQFGALIPLIFSPIAFAAAFVAGVTMRRTPVRFLKLAMWASVVIGLLGTYLHVTARPLTLADMLLIQTWLGYPPLLVPLSYDVAGLLGLIGTLAIRWEVSPAPLLEAEEKMPAPTLAPEAEVSSQP